MSFHGSLVCSELKILSFLEWICVRGYQGTTLRSYCLLIVLQIPLFHLRLLIQSVIRAPLFSSQTFPIFPQFLFILMNPSNDSVLAPKSIRGKLKCDQDDIVNIVFACGNKFSLWTNR